MGGYSRNEKASLGLIALIALRRAKAEQTRRTSKIDDDVTEDVDAVPAAKPRKRRGWFG